MPKLPEDHVHEFACPGLHTKGVPKGEKTWVCQHPDCFASFKRDRILGKRSICCICHTNEIILTPTMLKNAFPRCLECSESKDAKETRKMVGVGKSLMDDLLQEKEKEEIQNETK